PDMRLVENSLVPGPAVPGRLPLIAVWPKQPRGAVHVIDLGAAGGVGNDRFAYGKAVRGVIRRGAFDLEPAFRITVHPAGLVADQQTNRFGRRGPEAKSPAVAGDRFGAPILSEMGGAQASGSS